MYKWIPPGFPLDNRDADGAELMVGDRVLILTIPAWLIHDLPAEDQERLKSHEGRILTIESLDDYGYVWFIEDSFALRPAEVRLVSPHSEPVQKP